MTITHQRTGLIAIGVVVLMGLVPPWHYVRENSVARRDIPGGYALVFYPPNPPRVAGKDPVEDFFLQNNEKKGLPVQYDTSYSVKIDLVRLGLQWLLVVFVATGYALFGSAARRPQARNE